MECGGVRPCRSFFEILDSETIHTLEDSGRPCGLKPLMDGGDLSRIPRKDHLRLPSRSHYGSIPIGKITRSRFDIIAREGIHLTI
jgi:hypothetical protein